MDMTMPSLILVASIQSYLNATDHHLDLEKHFGNQTHEELRFLRANKVPPSMVFPNKVADKL